MLFAPSHVPVPAAPFSTLVVPCLSSRVPIRRRSHYSNDALHVFSCPQSGNVLLHFDDARPLHCPRSGCALLESDNALPILYILGPTTPCSQL
uniref:Uncharacterized protein n=1 Tax=Arundo donax TaxID=35708 RepID=A0A0A9VDY8_ARUDO